MDEEHMKTGAFVGGCGLVLCGLADAAIDPFAFITAPKLIGSGIAMIGISLGIGS